MSKVVFYGIPAYGHTNPALPLIAELINKGEEVICYSTSVFEKKITDTGAQYREYGYMRNFDTITAGKNLGLLYYMLSLATQEMLADLLSEIREINPDYIIHDGICMWGRYIASISNTPAIALITTFAYSNKNMKIGATLKFIHRVGFRGIKKMKEAYTIQEKLCKKYGTKPLHFIDSMMNEESLNVVFCSRAFQPHQEYYDERYHFVGPSMEKRINDPDTTDYSRMMRPLVYVSMGTVWSESFDLKVMIEALAPIDCTVVISCKNLGEYQSVNERMHIKEHVNQLEILRHADLFITHGGMNSVNEGLYNSVPLLLFPFQSEQEEVANRVVELGCGVKLNTMNVREIRDKARQVLGDASFLDSCRAVSASLKEAGGPKHAADCIVKHHALAINEFDIIG